MFILFVGGAVKVELILLISVSKHPAPNDLPVSFNVTQLVPLEVTSKLSDGERVTLLSPSIVPLVVSTTTLKEESNLFLITKVCPSNGDGNVTVLCALLASTSM
jgi:hypothetical protein